MTGFQNLSDEVERIAADAVAFAQQHPGLWIRPLTPHLWSCVRYSQPREQSTQSFFQVYLPHQHRNDLHAPDYEPDRGSSRIYGGVAEAVHGLKNNWYEESSVSDHYSSVGLIDLINQMGGKQTNRLQVSKAYRCFIELSPMIGFKKVVSADRRFPISISYPQELSVSMDFTFKSTINMKWSNSLTITRQNLGMVAQGGDREESRNARMVLQRKKDITQFMFQEFARRDAWALEQKVRDQLRKPWIEDKIIGQEERPIEAKRLVWSAPSGEYGGEWIFFMRARVGGTWPTYTKWFNPRAQLPEVWTIVNDASLDEGVFSAFVSSFKFLSPEAFCSLSGLNFGNYHPFNGLYCRFIR